LSVKAGTTEVHPWLAANISQSQELPAAALTELLSDIDQFRSAMLAFIESYDVMLCPVNAWPALPHDAWRDTFRQGAFS
jgi:amidase